LLSEKDMKKISIAQNNWYYIPLSSLRLHIELSGDKDNATLVLGNTPICGFTVKYEEGDFKLYSPPPSLGGIRTIYRNLRENYEYSLRYEEADEFFKREMELKRNYRKRIETDRIHVERNGFFQRNFTVTGLYHWISGYGLNYRRPACLALLVISLPIGFSLWQLSSINGGLSPDRGNYIEFS
jgi:hypothetical protein